MPGVCPHVREAEGEASGRQTSLLQTAAAHQQALPTCCQSRAVAPARFSPMKSGDAGKWCRW